MEIQSEAKHPFSVTHYDEKSITVGNIQYSSPLIISEEGVVPWDVEKNLTEETLTPLLSRHPKIILIGSSEKNWRFPMSLQASLSQKGIGVESMSIGAACRTFNILIGEGRKVVLGILF